MKILILSASSVSGPSGVDDYSQLLCKQLRLHAIDSIVYAVNYETEPSHTRLIAYIDEFKPDWISLQFVSYAYAKRGLIGPHSLPWQKLRGRLGSQILFHETWIGAHEGASLRQRSIGALQKWGIQNAMRIMRPDVVHTTNNLYSMMLEKAGILNTILPLYGSIPIAKSSPNPYLKLYDQLAPGTRHSDWLVLAFFGSIYPSINLFDALQWLQNKSLQQGKLLLIVSIGYSPRAEKLFKDLTLRLPYTGTTFFHVTGKLEPITASSWIGNANCGLSTTPFNIIDKSSSALAFREHGIPVVVMDKGDPVRNLAYMAPDLSPEVWMFGDERLNNFTLLPPPQEPFSRIACITSKFLSDLGYPGAL
jgi:hypothetical protein